ncbi:DUF2840 domain-containing protein [Alcaligenes faecalis]|uniref:DUF2840 domain-containing protein n=1 Tax=Alcaligenes faecalis TaxID=511 RepID=UPI001EF08AC7|nr:DUF2840 domain-containing protein [Alcaligenes faecalis]ULH06452.1 DUF2840 domain-containing protein [Alcaligenes faecalis]
MQIMTSQAFSGAAYPVFSDMRVTLGVWKHRASIRLRFGKPVRLLSLQAGQRVAVFHPAQLCARWVRIFNAYGLVRQELLIVQAPAPGQAMQRIAGISPGARILLAARTLGQVTALLSLLAHLQRDGWRLHEVSPCYWRAVHNRLHAHQKLPLYSHQRHAAWTARRGILE